MNLSNIYFSYISALLVSPPNMNFILHSYITDFCDKPIYQFSTYVMCKAILLQIHYLKFYFNFSIIYM